MAKKMNITVVGSGYVGMSMAVLLSQHHSVTILELNHVRVEQVNCKRSTVADPEIERFLSKETLELKATLDKHLAYVNAEFVVVATPTDYDPVSNSFDTASVDMVVKDALEINSNAVVVIKSTVPVGHTKYLQDKYETKRIIFSPEFLREGSALKDNLYPSRVIIGSLEIQGRKFAELLTQGAVKKGIETLFMTPTEAEAVKLFSNGYLAMRVSFFNELDSYALANGLDTKSIISGVCLDPRIGAGYNNPSFGYGGYCFPKDTKQLLSEYEDIPQNLIEAIVLSNSSRKNFIVEQIVKGNPLIVGIFGLAMKAGSDNFRFSAIQDVMTELQDKGVDMVIFEPGLQGNEFCGAKVLRCLDEFKRVSDVIIANRKQKCLKDVDEKCFSRDIFGDN